MKALVASTELLLALEDAVDGDPERVLEFDIPTHVAEWCEENCEHPTLYIREDCWVVEWGENNEHSVRIEKGDDYSELIEDGETEYTKVEEA